MSKDFMPKAFLSTHLPYDTIVALKKYTQEHGETQTSVVNQALVKFFASEKKGK